MFAFMECSHPELTLIEILGLDHGFMVVVLSDHIEYYLQS